VTRILRTAASAVIIFLCSSFGTAAFAEEAPSAPYFSVKGADHIERLPLLQTTATVDIVGPIADVTLKQAFENRGTATIEATYVFPASDRAAVSALTMIEHIDELMALPPATDSELRLEGRIWHPRWRHDRL